MADARRQLGAARLTREMQDEVLQRFWSSIDEDIRQGNLPPVE